MQLYGLTGLTIPKMRSTVREAFRRNASIKDFKVTDILRHKGEQVCYSASIAERSVLSASLVR